MGACRGNHAPADLPTTINAMKSFLTRFLFLAGLATASQAAVIVGTDVGYLVDSREEYLTARAGFEVARGAAFSHQLELEAGYSEAREAGLTADHQPIMLNYRAVAAREGAWGWTLGAGAGVARVKLAGASIVGPVSLRDEPFAAQAFAGVTYAATPAVSLSLGAKYLWIDDASFGGVRFDVDDDVALSAGVSFRF